MLFHVVYTFRDAGEEGSERALRLFQHWQPPAGFEFKVHYQFADGTEIRKAFSYSWRLWTLPEIRETLLEAGFSKALVYWEGTDPKTGEGDDEFVVAERGDADLGWIAYIVAER